MLKEKIQWHLKYQKQCFAVGMLILKLCLFNIPWKPNIIEFKPVVLLPHS